MLITGNWLYFLGVLSALEYLLGSHPSYQKRPFPIVKVETGSTLAVLITVTTPEHLNDPEI